MWTDIFAVLVTIQASSVEKSGKSVQFGFKFLSHFQNPEYISLRDGGAKM